MVSWAITVGCVVANVEVLVTGLSLRALRGSARDYYCMDTAEG